MVLLPEGLHALKQVVKEVGLDLRGAYLNLDGGFDSTRNRKCIFAVALKPRCEENRVIMGLDSLPATQPAWTRREPGGAHENPETIIRPTALDLST